MGYCLSGVRLQLYAHYIFFCPMRACNPPSGLVYLHRFYSKEIVLFMQINSTYLVVAVLAGVTYFLTARDSFVRSTQYSYDNFWAYQDATCRRRSAFDLKTVNHVFKRQRLHLLCTVKSAGHV